MCRERIEFSKWKVNRLKEFLNAVNKLRGYSNANKEILAKKDTSVWDELCCSTSDNPPDQRKVPDFEQCTINMLHDFLAKRGINRYGNKETLVTNAKNAFMMNIPVTQSNVQEGIEEIKSDLNDKLGLENGLIQLPNPVKLEDSWALAPANLPDTIYDQIILYLQSNDAGKAYKGGKSLLDSGHLTNTMVHSVSPNVWYCSAHTWALFSRTEVVQGTVQCLGHSS